MIGWTRRYLSQGHNLAKGSQDVAVSLPSSRELREEHETVESLDY